MNDVDRISEHRLRDIRYRILDASQGPWHSDLIYPSTPQAYGNIKVGNGNLWIEAARVWGPLRSEDLIFISTSREDLPVLLSEVERLQALIRISYSNLDPMSLDWNSLSAYELAQIKQRCCGATAGPWNTDYHTYNDMRLIETPHGSFHITPNPNDFSSGQIENDVAFIAHAREDIPYLLELTTNLSKMAEMVE